VSCDGNDRPAFTSLSQGRLVDLPRLRWDRRTRYYDNNNPLRGHSMKAARAANSHESAQERMKDSVSAKANLLRRWPLSATDRAIIGHLQEDGRRTFVTIARDLGLSEKTVRMRVHHLLQENIIQIAALTNPVALGYHAAALVGLTTDPGVPTSEIAVALREIPDLDYVIVTAGRYNLLVEIISHGTPSMQTVIEREIGRIRGIRSIEVFPYFSIYYQNARFFGVDGGSSFGWAVKEEELDPIDRRIVLELSNDGRAPLKEIAGRLDVSESQVRTRIGSMVNVGKMKIMAIVNPMNLPEHAIAYVAVQAKQNFSLHSVAEQLSQMPQVSYITICAGRYDLFIEVVCSSNNELLQTIDLGIRALRGVAKVETFIYFDLHYKRLTPMRG
jgi:Lrp/AsnC family transcriptional regulator for asnA, asnC and gidA